MRHLLPKVMIAMSLILSGCGDITLVKDYVCLSYVVDDLEPRVVECELKKANDESFYWKGIINKWIPNLDWKEYIYHWYEYSDGTHTLMYGTRK